MFIPQDVLELMTVIESSGFCVYLVGGCVRDSLLGLAPSDFDLATDAQPETLIEILPPDYSVFQVGQQFSTLVVRLADRSVELSTLRKRTEKGIVYEGSLLEDLACRDFTVNAMALSSKKEIIDPYGGQEDLNKRQLRSVNAQAVMEEDPLRALRAVRFSAKYNMTLDDTLHEALIHVAKTSPNVSPERKRDELFKMLIGSKPSESIRLMLKYDLFAWYTFGSLIERMAGYNQDNPFHDKTLLEHTLTVVDNTKPSLELRLAALFHDTGKPDVRTFDDVAHYYQHERKSAEYARTALKSLKCSNQLVENVEKLVDAHMFNPADIGTRGLKKLLRRMGSFKALYDLLDLMEADLLGTAYPERHTIVDGLRSKVRQMEEKETVFKTKDLSISGKDLIDMGIEEGREIGIWLESILEAVIDEALENEREALLKFVKDRL